MTQTVATPKIDLDSHIQDQWTKEESQNVGVVVDFFQHLMNEHNFEYTLKTYGGGSYLQHNRAIPNDISGLVNYVKNMTKRFPEYGFDVKRISADGEFVILHSHTTLKAKHRGNEKKGLSSPILLDSKTANSLNTGMPYSPLTLLPVSYS